MGRHRRQRRNLALETPSSAGENKTAMLLYEAPSGIAIFSFNDSYLESYLESLDSAAKDFWKFLPPLRLEIIILYKTVPIDFANKSIENTLANSLTELCGSEKALVVGSAEYKIIIKTKLRIGCVHVDVPGCEVILRHLKEDPICSTLGFSGYPTAMLLYKAPSGIAIFSFEERYLNGLAEDFWACLPPLSLKEFMAYERVPTPFDLDNNAMDDCLVQRLMELCCEKKLVVGSAEQKGIYETKLGITCLYVDIPDCEVNICSVKKPMHTLLPDEKADPVKDIMLFLRQHYFDIPDGKVDASFSTPALHLHNIELCEMDHLKFFRLLLSNFMSRASIDTKNWALIQFATALKMICYPLASYEVYHPVKIFSPDVYSKIVRRPLGCKDGFFKIDALSVYNKVVGLCSQKSRHLNKLDFLVRKATDMKVNHFPLTNGIFREIYNNESKLEADNSVLGSVMGELDATSTRVRSLQDEVTTRVIDVAIHPAEKDAPDLSVAIDAGATQGADASAEVEGADASMEVEGLTEAMEILALTEQENEHALTQVEKIDMSLLDNNEISEVMRWLAKSGERMDALSENVPEWWSKESRFVSPRKSTPATKKAEMDKYLNENAELLKQLNHRKAQLREANKTADADKAECLQLDQKLADVVELNGLLTGLREAKKTTEEPMTNIGQSRLKIARLMERGNENDGLLEKVNQVQEKLNHTLTHSVFLNEERLLKEEASLKAELRFAIENINEVNDIRRSLEYKVFNISKLKNELAVARMKKLLGRDSKEK